MVQPKRDGHLWVLRVGGSFTPPLLPVYLITLSFNPGSQISPGGVPGVSRHFDFADIGQRPS